MSTPKYDRRSQQFKDGLLDVEDLLNDLSTLEERLADEKRHSSTLDFTLSEIKSKITEELKHLTSEIRSLLSTTADVLVEKQRFQNTLSIVRDTLKSLPVSVLSENGSGVTSTVFTLIDMINDVLEQPTGFTKVSENCAATQYRCTNCGSDKFVDKSP